MAIFFCPQGDRCREVQLLCRTIGPFILSWLEEAVDDEELLYKIEWRFVPSSFDFFGVNFNSTYKGKNVPVKKN